MKQMLEAVQSASANQIVKRWHLLSRSIRVLITLQTWKLHKDRSGCQKNCNRIIIRCLAHQLISTDDAREKKQLRPCPSPMLDVQGFPLVTVGRHNSGCLSRYLSLGKATICRPCLQGPWWKNIFNLMSWCGGKEDQSILLRFTWWKHCLALGAEPECTCTDTLECKKVSSEQPSKNNVQWGQQGFAKYSLPSQVRATISSVHT